MGDYSCKNCANLKTRILTPKSINHLKKKNLTDALRRHEADYLGLNFPFNLTAYKRIKKYKECQIIYCSANMFGRDLYIYRDNVESDKRLVPVVTPCPRYK